MNGPQVSINRHRKYGYQIKKAVYIINIVCEHVCMYKEEHGELIRDSFKKLKLNTNKKHVKPHFY